jgi:hypothetical protein
MEQEYLFISHQQQVHGSDLFTLVTVAKEKKKNTSGFSKLQVFIYDT